MSDYGSRNFGACDCGDDYLCDAHRKNKSDLSESLRDRPKDKIDDLEAEVERVKAENQTIAKAYKDLVANIERVDAEEKSKLEIALEALEEISHKRGLPADAIAEDALARMKDK